MRTLLALLLLTGCAASSADKTKDFLAQERHLSETCMAPYAKVPFAAKFDLDPATGHSPFFAIAACYDMSIRPVAQFTNPDQLAAADYYSTYLVRLAGSVDRGQIARPAAIELYRQATALFIKSLSDRDAASAEVSRKEFFTRLSTSMGTLSTTLSEQDRQRAASQPVHCFVTGVYRRDGITCM